MRTLTTKQPTARNSAHQKPLKKSLPKVPSWKEDKRSRSTGLTGSTMLQRKPGCACGGGCPRCQERTLLQTKLKIGEPGDEYEQEADRIADEVMRMPETSKRRQIEPEEEEEEIVQTKSTIDRVTPLSQTQESSGVPSTVHEVLNSPGQPLSSKTRTFMESRFGHNFNQIRVHTDAKAAKSAAEINAQAYTVQHNIVFATGRYAPDTQPGRQLLAHELTHSLQQSIPVVSGMIQRQHSGSAQTSTPCPTVVSIGQIAQFNHSNLPVADQQEFHTYLGAVSRMDVGPGNDHSGHCMKEHLETVSNTCPAAVYHRNGRISEPCTGNKCLDINRYPSPGVGDPRTKTKLTDGPTSFIDLHRTRNRNSLLEGTGVDSCSVICEQIYKCDRTAATTGRFRITRNYQADMLNTVNGSIHITTGTVTKTHVTEAAPVESRRFGLEIRGGLSLLESQRSAALSLGGRFSLRSERAIVINPLLGARLLYLPPSGDRITHLARVVGEVGLRIQQPLQGVYLDLRAGGYVGIELPSPETVIGGFSGSIGLGYRSERIELGAEVWGALGINSPNQFIVLGMGSVSF